jgi:LmbE family N-acetylglucosaminyl deacetylase
MNTARSDRVVVVSPHLDDAVLGAWTALTADDRVEVVNVFTAMPPAGTLTRYDRLLRATDSAALFAERLREDAEALALAGRSARGLGLLERQYRDGPVDREALAAALAEAVKGCSALLAPAGIGGHEDHVAVRDACFELADAVRRLVLYAELPYAIHKGWPEWVTGAEPDPHLDPASDWHACLATAPCPRDALRPEVRTLGDAEADAKLHALRTYRTQFASLNSGSIDRFGDREARRYEVFWSVEPGR